MVLTFALGIVPATMLVFWAIALGAAGATALFELGDPEAAFRGLLAIAAAVLSIFGYVALFYAAGDAVTSRVALWLGAGVVANVVGVGFVVGEPEYLKPGVLFMLFSPLVVGCAHLARFTILTRQRRAGVRRPYEGNQSMLASSRLVFCACLLAVVTASHAQRLDANRVRDLSGLVTMIGSLQHWRDICTSLFPLQATVIQGIYEASSVGEYAKRFGYELNSPPMLDRDKALESLGMSEGEAASWCLSDLPEMLDQFDELYENRVQEMQDTFTGIEKAMAERPSNSAKPQQSPQPKELSDLFSRIVEASNRAYETGDWSVVADLYEPGTFDCWAGVRDAGQFAFLSLPPLSPNATFEVSKFTEYLMGGPYAFTNGRPTHLMETSDEFSRPAARCGLEQRQRWPRSHFFLVQRDNQFGLTHYCPSKEAIEAGTVSWGRPLSAAQAAANVAELTDADWEAISTDIKRDRYSPRSQERLVREHGFSYEEADAVIDYVCDPMNTR